MGCGNCYQLPPPHHCSVRCSTEKCWKQSALPISFSKHSHGTLQTVVFIWANKYVYPPHTSNSGMPFSSWGFFLFYFSLCIKMTSGNLELIKLPFYTFLYSSLVSFILRIIYPQSNFCIQIMLFCHMIFFINILTSIFRAGHKCITFIQSS